jgi:hypothetical protein
MSSYTYAYDLPLPTGETARITPCGAQQLRATSDLVEVPGGPPFYVHKLEPMHAPVYYQLTGNPRQYATLDQAITAHLQGGSK